MTASPFLRPSLHVFSPSARRAKVLARACALFTDATLPHRFDSSHVHVSSSDRDVHDVLDDMAPAVLRHCACVIDLAGEKPETLFSAPIKGQQLQPLTLPVRYPEVFWIFLVESMPPIAHEGVAAGEPLHWCCFSQVERSLQALLRHASGLRTWFDATQLRWHAITAIQSTESTLPEAGRHSAPFWAQAIASALIRRAMHIRSQPATTEDAVMGAALALDAWRLLDGQTMALCLEALKLMNELEVLAECSFVGTAAGPQLRYRFSDLQQMVNEIHPSRGVYSRQQPHTTRVRPPVAAAIDEEERYVVFNAYLLYRYEFSAYVVASAAEFHQVAGPAGAPLRVVLEDMDLQFADGSADLTLPARAAELHYPRLQSVQDRVFVSSANPADPAVAGMLGRVAGIREGRLDELLRGPSIGAGPRLNLVTKPHGGIFDRELSRILKRHRAEPSTTDDRAGMWRRSGSHRAVSSVEEKPAVDQSQAKRPVAAQAPAEQRASERKVVAETRVTWRKQRLHALMTCADGLVNIYRSYNQYQESEDALNEVRLYEASYGLPGWLANGLLWMFHHARIGGGRFQWIIRAVAKIEAVGSSVVLAYATTAVRSLGTLISFTVFWVLVFTALIALGNDCPGWWYSLEYTAMLFLELQMPSTMDLSHPDPVLGKWAIQCQPVPEAGHIVVWLALACAYLHLGLLISLLVDRVVRRT